VHVSVAGIAACGNTKFNTAAFGVPLLLTEADGPVVVVPTVIVAAVPGAPGTPAAPFAPAGPAAPLTDAYVVPLLLICTSPVFVPHRDTSPGAGAWQSPLGELVENDTELPLGTADCAVAFCVYAEVVYKSAIAIVIAAAVVETVVRIVCAVRIVCMCNSPLSL
jgi:hypothetical protein